MRLLYSLLLFVFTQTAAQEIPLLLPEPVFADSYALLIKDSATMMLYKEPVEKRKAVLTLPASNSKAQKQWVQKQTGNSKGKDKPLFIIKPTAQALFGTVFRLMQYLGETRSVVDIQETNEHENLRFSLQPIAETLSGDIKMNIRILSVTDLMRKTDTLRTSLLNMYIAANGQYYYAINQRPSIQIQPAITEEQLMENFAALKKSGKPVSICLFVEEKALYQDCAKLLNLLRRYDWYRLHFFLGKDW
jgi:biopolymer transport protein ExbD